MKRKTIPKKSGGAKLRPAEVAKRILQRLKSMSDPVRAEGARRYFKEEFQCFGLTAPELRGVAAEIFATVRPVWTVDEAIELCDLLLPNPYHEAKVAAILILERYRTEFPERLFFKIRGWLEQNVLNTWATVDALCPGCLGRLLEEFPDLRSKIKAWAGSPNRWVRRASIVSFLRLAKSQDNLDAIYEMAESHLGDRDDLIQKANGWLLREAGKKDLRRLEKFLLENGPKIPRTTLRYAIERFEASKRDELLRRTRPPASMKRLRGASRPSLKSPRRTRSAALPFRPIGER